MPDPALSVVICTYNRARLLWAAAATACDQNADPASFEVLVVDNNSGDETVRAVRSLQRRFANLRYCREEAQGLSHARNRGWREARGRYVGFVDDDALVPEQWVTSALRILAAEAPAAVGGPYFPFYDSPRPAWFRATYGSMSLGPRHRRLGPGEYLSGGNMIWRRELLEALGGFDPAFGMKGEHLGYGEEADLQERLRRELPGETVRYDPALKLYHLVRPERMRLAFVLRDALAHGLAHAPAGGPGLLHGLAASCWHLAPGLLIRDRERHPRWQQYVYERAAPALEALGGALGRWRGRA